MENHVAFVAIDMDRTLYLLLSCLAFFFSDFAFFLLYFLSSFGVKYEKYNSFQSMTSYAKFFSSSCLVIDFSGPTMVTTSFPTQGARSSEKSFLLTPARSLGKSWK